MLDGVGGPEALSAAPLEARGRSRVGGEYRIRVPVATGSVDADGSRPCPPLADGLDRAVHGYPSSR